MKKQRYYISFAFYLLVAFNFSSCQSPTTKEKDLISFGIQTIEHDSCEYVIFKDTNRSSVAMLHKQNCKYCAQRKNETYGN